MPDGLGHNMGISASAQISVPADPSLPLQRLLPLFEPGSGNYHRGDPANAFTMLNAVWGFMDQHLRGTYSLPAASFFCLAGFTDRSSQLSLPALE